MSGIRFESARDRLEILNPLKQFQVEVQEVEVRRDPLLGSVSVYNAALQGKAKAFFGEVDWALVTGLAQESAARCIFCRRNIERTARYTPQWLPEGRIEIGEAILFPNLFALGKHHAVVVMSEAHFLRLSEFRSELIADALRAAQRLVCMVYASDAAATYVTVNANYLFPAGASQLHPHLQLLVTSQAYSYHARLADACRAYLARHGNAYHTDLVSEERALGTRYITATGAWHWLASYAPVGGHELLAVHESSADFGQLTDRNLTDLAQGLASALRFYERLGCLSFNWTLLSVRAPQAGGFHCLLKLINRQNPYANYRNDDYFLQKLLQTELILMLPEDLAREARALFPAP